MEDCSSRQESRRLRCPFLVGDIPNVVTDDAEEDSRMGLAVVERLAQVYVMADQERPLGTEDFDGLPSVDAVEAGLGSLRWEAVRPACRTVAVGILAVERLHNHTVVVRVYHIAVLTEPSMSPAWLRSPVAP